MFGLLFVCTAQLDFGERSLLDAEVGQEIAERLAEPIGHNVLLANEKGIIVGSSDLERVGTFHEPSVEAIKKKITTVQSSTTHLMLRSNLRVPNQALHLR